MTMNPQYLSPVVVICLGLAAPTYAQEAVHLDDKAKCLSLLRNVVCIPNLTSFIEDFDGKQKPNGEDHYGKKDGLITPEEIIWPTIYAAIPNADKVRDMPRGKLDYNLIDIVYQRLKRKIFDPFDINNDEVISKADDANGDNMVTSEDKKLHEDKKKQEKKK